MLRFNFVVAPYAQVGDQVDDLKDQLQEAGQGFTVSREFLPPPIFNLYCESAFEPGYLIELSKAGYQLIVVLTEEPTLVSTEGLVWNYNTIEGWVRRAEDFVRTAPHLIAAWCYVVGSAARISKWVRAADIDAAYGPRFSRSLLRNEDPVNDFCFFGRLTERRARIIEELRCGGHSVDVIPHNSTLVQRDARIPMAKVVLDIKQEHWWQVASGMRYVTALCRGRPVIAEGRDHPSAETWNRVVHFVGPDKGFIVAARAMLQDWKTVWETQEKALRISHPSHIPAAIKKLPKPRAAIPGIAHIKRSEQIAIPPSEPLVFPIANGDVGPPRLVASVRGVNLVRFAGNFWVIPQNLGKVHLERLEERMRPGIRRFATYAEAQEALG